ncbi:MAG TPA: hypothetical protein EYP34_07950 [Chromatiaceae bacterium]|nr:hypothetical protein [Chromatiaceae bacterium]
MHTSLYLFPLPVLDEPPPDTLIPALLRDCGFLGDGFEASRYLAGPAFFQHITFAGCAPHLQLERPVEGGHEFCHISIVADQQPPPLRVALGRGRPRCPSCRAGVPGWQENLPNWEKDSARRWRCEACGGDFPIAELDWRQYGVGARCVVEIHQVYPGEALPGDGLMQLLSAGTGREWRHAWANGSGS